MYTAPELRSVHLHGLREGDSEGSVKKYKDTNTPSDQEGSETSTTSSNGTTEIRVQGRTIPDSVTVLSNGTTEIRVQGRTIPESVVSLIGKDGGWTIRFESTT